MSALIAGCVSQNAPAEAIVPDTKDGSEIWLETNRSYAAAWPNISKKKDALPDADAWKGVENKFKEHFSPKPGA